MKNLIPDLLILGLTLKTSSRSQRPIPPPPPPPINSIKKEPESTDL